MEEYHDEHNDHNYDVEDDEALIEKIEEDNQRYLDIFKTSLEESGLKQRTINKHVYNVEFYLDDYLAGYYLSPMQDGVSPGTLDSYFDDFYIRKASWSSPSNMKQEVTSLKKFYKCMADHGFVSESDYKEMVKAIKEDMPGWVNRLEKYSDPDVDFDDIWSDIY